MCLYVLDPDIDTFVLNNESARRSDLTLWFCYVERRAKELIEQKRLKKAREEAEVTVPLLSSSVSQKYTKLCAFLLCVRVCVCMRVHVCVHARACVLRRCVVATVLTLGRFSTGY